MTRARRFIALLLPAAIGSGSCGDSGTDPPEEQLASASPTLPALIVSESAESPVTGSSAVASGPAAVQVTYVSLPPGTLPVEIVNVRIRNTAAAGGATVEADLVDGGFDPAPVAAAEGDELELTFTSATGQLSLAYAKVPPERPPVIVRTSPPRGRTDVALGTRPAVIFSEPVDPASLAGSVRLVAGGSTVAVQVELLPGAPWAAELVPAQMLRPETAYELVITRGVRDLSGASLDSALTVTFTTGPQLNLDGEVAFVSTREGSPYIYVARPDGSGLTRLTSGERPSWSPDGRRIAFERGGRGMGPFPQGAEVYLIDVDGSNETRLTAGMQPAWSPDGTQIAFVDNAGISVIGTDGSEGPRLVRHDANLAGEQPGFYSGSPAWSPDGTRIAFEHSSYAALQQIYIMKADGSEPRRLTDPAASTQSAECEPAWAPDGSRIAFWSYFLGLATIDAIGTGAPRSLYGNSYCGQGLDWSPDGAVIAFSIFHAHPGEDLTWRGRIYVLPSRGGALHQLLPDVVAPANPTYSDYAVTWSQGGR